MRTTADAGGGEGFLAGGGHVEGAVHHDALGHEAAAGLLFSQVNSWQTGVNRNVEGRDVRRVLGYYGGAVAYRRKAEAVAAGGYQEFQFG